jgi:uncharacterized protein
MPLAKLGTTGTGQPAISTLDLAAWEPKFEALLRAQVIVEDPAHDLDHVRRVVHTARRLAATEGANLSIVIPAAWLHDLVAIPKNDPRRSQASRMAAETAACFLSTAGYPGELVGAITHAIEAHSFSAGIIPRTIEAAVVQDADRLEALGAIGIARCFSTAGTMGRRYYEPSDPFAEHRPPDDADNTLDHFGVKLFKVAATLRTAAGREEGGRRAAFMRTYLDELKREIMEARPGANGRA